MRKQTIMIAIVSILGFLLVTWLPCQGDDNVIYGCYKKNNGQLRIVSDHSECLKSEKTITLFQTNGISITKLACVTCAMAHPTETSADIAITNQKNTSVNDCSEVFNIIYVQENPYSEDPYPENLYWGLQCKDEWVNTGCSQSNEISSQADRDIPQYNNGCFSDNDEIEYFTIFTTCCKIVNIKSD